MEGIVDLPASGSGASQASPENAKDTDKGGQGSGAGERQGAGVGSRSGDVIGSPNGSRNSSGRKKEVDLVSSFLSLFGVRYLSWFSTLYSRGLSLDHLSSVLVGSAGRPGV